MQKVYLERRGGPGAERAGPQEAASSRKRPPATDYNSQHPPQLPVGKMVARRRKRAVPESDSGVPTLPGYSGEGMRGARPGSGHASPRRAWGVGSGSGPQGAVTRLDVSRRRF